MSVALLARPANDDLMGFGSRLREARERTGLSQEALAHRVGVGWKTIQRYEKGDNEPTTALARDLAIVLDCDIAWLVSGEAHPDEDDKVPPNLARFLATDFGSTATDTQRAALMAIKNYTGDTSVAKWRALFAQLLDIESEPYEPTEEDLGGLMKVEK